METNPVPERLKRANCLVARAEKHFESLSSVAEPSETQKSKLVLANRFLQLARLERDIVCTSLSNQQKYAEGVDEFSKENFSLLLESKIKDYQEKNTVLKSKLCSGLRTVSELKHSLEKEEEEARRKERACEEKKLEKEKVLHNLRCLKEGLKRCSELKTKQNHEKNDNKISLIGIENIAEEKQLNKKKQVDDSIQKFYFKKLEAAKTSNLADTNSLKSRLRSELDVYATNYENELTCSWKKKIADAKAKLRNKQEDMKMLRENIEEEKLQTALFHDLKAKLPNLINKHLEEAQKDSVPSPEFLHLKAQIPKLLQEIYKDQDDLYLDQMDEFLHTIVELLPTPNGKILSLYKNFTSEYESHNGQGILPGSSTSG